MNITEIIPAVLVLLGSTTFASIIAIIAGRKREEANLADILQKIAKQTAEDLEEERQARSALERRFNAMETYIDELLDGIRVLVNQLKGNGLKPDWLPGERPTRPASKKEGA